MKHALILPILLIAWVVGGAGCATDQSVFQGGSSLTASVPNPVTLNDMAGIESTVGALRAAAVNYRRLGICPAGTSVSDSLLQACALRSAVLASQKADQKVTQLLIPMRNFVRNNQTVSALSSIGALRQAVSDFQNVASTYGMK